MPSTRASPPSPGRSACRSATADAAPAGACGRRPMALKLGSNDRVRIERIETLSDNWYVLRKVTFDWRRRDGSWQRQARETYDRGNGAAALLYSRSGLVVLTRQFRMPTFVNGHDGMLIETAAGLLDEADPETAIRKEIEEETGYRPKQ